MKKSISYISLLLASLMFGTLAEAQVAANWEVGTWYQFKPAAVSYTIDDGTARQFSVALPIFDSYNYKVTLNTVINWSPNWGNLSTLSKNGHEIASHTVSHLNFSGASVSSQDTECKNSQSTINSNVTNTKCVTIAYPNCNMGDRATISKYYIAGRVCSGQIVSSTPSDMYQISSIVCGSEGLNTAQALNDKVASAKNSKGWCVFLFHGFDADGGYSPMASSILSSHLSYMNTNNPDYWVGTFVNVVKYIKERNAASLAETAITSDSLKITLTDNLDNAMYDAAISVRRVIPTGWTKANVWQNNTKLSSSIVSANGKTYVMFSAVPDAGAIYVANPDAKSVKQPVVTSPLLYRQNSTAPALSATGTSLKWYTSASGGTASTTAPVPSTTVVGSFSYYVTQTINNEESSRAVITVNVYAPQAAYGGTPAAIPGTIQFENYDEGGADTAYSDSSPGSSVTPVVNFRTTEDVDVETCTDAGAGYNIGYAMAGEWLEYTVNVAATGKYDLTLRVACDNDNRTVSVDAKGVSIAKDIAIPNTGGWQTWEDVVVKDVSLVAGVQVIRVTIGASDYINLNYMTFTAVNVATPPTVNITSPADKSSFTDAQTITISATATATTGTITNVKFYNGTTLLNTDNTAPYSFDWKEMTAGDYTITAEATDSNGQTSSKSVTVSVTVAPVVYTFQLHAGWNNIGCPIEGGTDIATALASVWSQVDAVKNFESLYLSSNTPALNTLNKLEWGKGYMIKVKTNCVLTWSVK